jgi:ABC-type lipoprotein release transport system permease subunit
MLFLKIGFRNLWKNSKRTLIACMAVGVGIAALIFVDGLLIGTNENMIVSATNGLLSQGQIQNKEYELTGDPKFVIKGIADVRTRLNDINGLSYSERVLVQGMVSGARGAKNTIVYGIDHQTESKVTKVHKYISMGDMPSQKRDIVLGRKLVEDLKLSMGDRIVVTFSNVKTGELVQSLFRLSGVVSFGSNSIDGSIVFINLKTAREYLGLEGQSNQIALNFGDPFYAGNKDLNFWKEFSDDTNSAKGYNTLVPGVEAMQDYSFLMKFIMISLLGVLVAIGIVNTLFMSIMERIYEFGVIRAIGTTKFEVIKIILFEALGLGLLSSLIGCILSLFITFAVNVNGIDMGGVEFNSVTFSEPVYIFFQPIQYIEYPLIIVLITMAVSLYPAFFACRIKPTEAMGNRI